MNFQVFVTLSLVAAILVISHPVNGQSGETNTTDTSSTATAQSPSSNTTDACGTDGGLVALLGQVGNLLGNLLNNIPLLKQLGLTNPGGLLDLAGLLVQVQKLLNGLLSSLKLGNLNLTSANGRIATLLAQVTTLLNNLLGGDKGTKWSCQNSGGSTGGPLGQLIDGVGIITTGSDATRNIGLITLVNFLLQLVGTLLKALGVNNIVGGLGLGL